MEPLTNKSGKQSHSQHHQKNKIPRNKPYKVSESPLQKYETLKKLMKILDNETTSHVHG
jgi:hypothetical protein